MGVDSRILNKLKANRIILICGYIDTEKASKIIFQLLSMGMSNGEIHFYIASDGGDYLDILAIIDTMNSLKNKFAATCIGRACGYAALLLACCTKGSRFALKHSFIQFDQPVGCLQAGVNRQTDIAIEAQEIKKERDIFEKLLSQATGKDISKIHSDCEAGVEMNSAEALEYGIIDKIIGEG